MIGTRMPSTYTPLSSGSAPRITNNAVPNGVRAAPGRVWITLSGSPKVPGIRLTSSMLIVRRVTSSGGRSQVTTTISSASSGVSHSRASTISPATTSIFLSPTA